MYYHNENTHRVEWNPEHTAHAVTAMQEHVSGFEYQEGVFVEVDNETRQTIKTKYFDLLTNDPNIDYPPEKSE